MHDKTNIMIQIELKEVPEKYIKKFKREYILEQKKEYKAMGMNYNLTDLQIDEDINYFFRKCLFFYDPFNFTFFYSKPINF